MSATRPPWGRCNASAGPDPEFSMNRSQCILRTAALATFGTLDERLGGGRRDAFM